MTVLQVLLLSDLVTLYVATCRGWRWPESKYKIYDSDSYFDRDRKNDPAAPEKSVGDFRGEDIDEPNPEAWMNSSSRGMSLPAFMIGRSEQAEAEQAPGYVIRDDTVR